MLATGAIGTSCESLSYEWRVCVRDFEHTTRSISINLSLVLFLIYILNIASDISSLTLVLSPRPYISLRSIDKFRVHDQSNRSFALSPRSWAIL